MDIFRLVFYGGITLIFLLMFIAYINGQKAQKKIAEQIKFNQDH